MNNRLSKDLLYYAGQTPEDMGMEAAMANTSAF